MRPILLYDINEHSNLTAVHLEPLWQAHFGCEPLDPDRDYDPKRYLIWTGYASRFRWWESWRDRGFRVVIDHLWDNPTDVNPVIKDNVMTLQAGNFIWYNESLWYQDLGHHEYQRQPINKSLFLMLMRKPTSHRDAIYDLLAPMIDSALYSYIGRGITLPDDITTEENLHQRWFNPRWYDETCFSMVIESVVRNDHSFSEKSIKPMAFQHPEIIWGSPFTLQYLKQIGFCTWDHIVNESYDDIIDDTERLNHVVKEMSNLYELWLAGEKPFSDTESMKRIEHNYRHFYNSRIPEYFTRDIIRPLLEFAHA